MGIGSFAQRGNDAYTGDDDVAGAHAGLILGSGSLGGYESVDLGAQVLHDEVFLGGSLAVIYLLGPLFQRDLDAEFLVDSKDNVEEIEAVDPQIVDCVAFGRNLVAVDLARL